MFQAKTMRKIELLCLASESQEMALLLARHGGFSPAGATGNRPGQRYRDIYLEAAARLHKILQTCDLQAPLTIPVDAIAPNERELTGINNRLREIWQSCSGSQERELRLEAEKIRLATLRETYARLSALDVDLARLLRRDGLLDSRLGQLPVANLKRLSDALSVAGYLLTEFDRAGDQAFVVVAGPRNSGGSDRLGGLLAQAGWRDLPVPAELRTEPSAAAHFLETEAQRLDDQAAKHCEHQQCHLQRHAAWIGQARTLLELARPLAESALLGLSGTGQLAVFMGWVPRQSLADLRAQLETRFKGRFLLRSQVPNPDDRVPSLLEYPAWLRPFSVLVQSYGIPRYGEFDPSLLFACAYVLLFGAMFGDIGHGAVLLVLALLLHGRLDWLRWVGAAAALASIGFGFLYGSVFGHEDWLTPIWQSPLHDPTGLLWLAVLFGGGFIALTLSINIYNRLAARDWGQALLAGGGLAGLLFYLGAWLTLHAMLLGQAAGLPALLAGLALGAAALHSGSSTSGPPGERLVVALVETLETAISLFANTLSFLRVAAFSLNHVALSLAVFAIASGLEGVGHGLAVLLGNLVIIVLEGAIVAIQALRLLYYEGFSRFFAGDGELFRPLRLMARESCPRSEK